MAEKNLQNIDEIGPFGDDFWRPRFYKGQFGPECNFLTFQALQDGFIRFFSKNFLKTCLITNPQVLPSIFRYQPEDFELKRKGVFYRSEILFLEDEWLDDEIINRYLILIRNRSQKSKNVPS